MKSKLQLNQPRVKYPNTTLCEEIIAWNNRVKCVEVGEKIKSII